MREPWSTRGYGKISEVKGSAKISRDCSEIGDAVFTFFVVSSGIAGEG